MPLDLSVIERWLQRVDDEIVNDKGEVIVESCSPEDEAGDVQGEQCGFDPRLVYGQSVEIAGAHEFAETMAALKASCLRLLPPGTRFEIRLSAPLLLNDMALSYTMGWISHPSDFAAMLDWQDFEGESMSDPLVQWDIMNGSYVCARLHVPCADVPPWDNRLEECDG